MLVILSSFIIISLLTFTLVSNICLNLCTELSFKVASVLVCVNIIDPFLLFCDVLIILCAVCLIKDIPFTLY